MEIILNNNKKQWDLWLEENCSFCQFSQGFDWGEILIKEGKKVERLQITENGNILLQAQIIYQNLPFGWHYVFCPKGPIINKAITNNEQLVKKVIECFNKYFLEKQTLFLRIEPELPILINYFTAKKNIDINPRATLILDLKNSEEEILNLMHQKTRYNIKLAQKKNLQIKVYKDINIFIKLMEETGARDGFKLHPKKHYEKIINSNLSEQITIFKNNEAIAVGVFIGFGNTFTYLYGASNYEHRNLMAPYLIQWEGIKLGKKLNYENYDFFGIAPCQLVKENKSDKVEYVYDLKHQYAGVTKFKLGFGGNYHEDPGTYDKIINKNKYYIYSLLRFLRRKF